MTPSLQSLINALRRELEQHGELLARLDDLPAAGSGKDHAAAVRAVEIQTATLLTVQRERERLQVQFAWAASQPGACSFEELIPVMPASCRPLVAALVEENESLRDRVAKRLRDDLCWFDRACELSNRTLDVISFPAHHRGMDFANAPENPRFSLIFNA